MLKTFIAALIALGLVSPFCLCGDAATESHAAVTKASECHSDHQHPGHPHEGEDSEEEGHSHSHSDLRLSVSSSVSVPAIAVLDLAAWAIVVPKPSFEPVVSAVVSLATDDSGPPSRPDAPVTGVFLI